MTGGAAVRALAVIGGVAVVSVAGATQQVTPTGSEAVRQAADTSTRDRIVVSKARRLVWYISRSGDTLYQAPVAIGSGQSLTSAGRAWRFTTPTGIRAVQSKERDPVWVRPDWGYIELARQKKLRLETISATSPRLLASGDSLVVRNGAIGTVRRGAFTPWPEGSDVVIGGVLYMPPAGSRYRRVPGVLGKFRLNLGGAIGLHGTLDTASVGRAATHGCMRLHDADIEWLFHNVALGTPVFIY